MPDDIAWWPPAPGWWLLLLLAALTGGGLAYWRRRQQRRRTGRQIRQQLTQIGQQLDYPQTALHQLSQLLRRIALSYYPRDQVAGLHGENWLAFLDQGFDDRPFQNGIGRCLLDSQYRPIIVDDLDWPALLALCERWLQRLESQS